MLLTFKENKFILTDVALTYTSDPLLFKAIAASGLWLTNDRKTLTTTNVLAALKFIDLADSKAKHILTTRLLRRMPPPKIIECAEGETLFDFQKNEGIPFILSRNRSYLAHQPGLGKTAQAVCAVNSKPGKATVFCPAMAKNVWAREITKWFKGAIPGISFVPESSKKEEMNWDDDFVICSHSMILKDWVREGLYRRKQKFTFIDEGQNFKEPTSLRSQALFGGQNKKFRSPGLVYKSEHVSVLSGTPMLGKAIELWPICFALAPEIIDFMSYKSFGFKFGKAIQNYRGDWVFSGSSNEAELHRRLVDSGFMQIKKKADVLKDLPSKIREVVVMDVDPRSSNLLKFDIELQNKLDLSVSETPQSIGDYAVYRHEIGLAKADWVAKFVSDILDGNPDEMVILYAHHRDVVQRLAKNLIKFEPMIINGQVPMEIRTSIQDQFQSRRKRLIIGNVDSMKLAITLTESTRVVFCEYSWTPADNEQAEDRANRIGSKWSVYCQYIVAPNSLDYKIINSNLEKAESIRKII